MKDERDSEDEAKLEKNGKNDNLIQEIEILDTPDKPLVDKKEYRVIRLHNGLTALLISNLASVKECHLKSTACEEGIPDVKGSEEEENKEKKTDDEENIPKEKETLDDKNEEQSQESAAALCIGVGSLEDPPEIPGLMHLLEHMVLTGSEKYPREDCFINSVIDLIGFNSSRTYAESTTFSFEVQEINFEKCLDIFASLFVSPLIKEEEMQREKETVQSEFEHTSYYDNCVTKRLMHSFANQDHPVSSFHFGNEKSLQLNVSAQELHAKLHEFRSKYYSAQYMSLAVEAKETLDKLQEIVVSKFSEIPNNGLPKPSYERFGFPYSQKIFNRIYKVIPLYEYSNIKLTWAMPPLNKNFYESKPLKYISHLLGYLGSGSLNSVLKESDWVINSWTSWSNISNSTCDLLYIYIYVKNEGFLHMKDIIRLVFQYVQLMKEEGPNPSRFSELQKMKQNDFDFVSNDYLCTNAKCSSSAMDVYPSKHILSGRSLLFKYDPQIIEECLSKIDVKNMNIMLSSQHFEKENLSLQEEEWYGTKYCVEDIPQDWIEEWENVSPNPELHLPLPNELISEDFEIYKWSNSKQDPPEFPHIIESNEKGKLWFKQDFKFCLPRAHCKVYFQFQDIGKSPEVGAVVDLFLNFFNIRMRELTYPAILAQYETTMSVCDLGFVLNIEGLNHKMYNCFEMILDYIQGFDKLMNDKIFDAMKIEQLGDYYRSINLAEQLVNDTSLHILKGIYWPVVMKMKALENMQRNHFMSLFLKEIFPNKFVEMLVQGNMKEKEAKKIFNLILQTSFNSTDEQKSPQMQVRRYKDGEYIASMKSLDTVMTASTITNYYQGDLMSPRNELFNEFLVLLLEESADETLRGNDGIGYYVICSSTNIYGVLGISVMVNTEWNVSFSYANEKIDAFLKTTLENLKRLPEEKVLDLKRTLKKERMIFDKTLQEEVERNWRKIANGQYMFDLHIKQIPLISEITVEEAHDYLQNFIIPSIDSNYRKVSIQVMGYPSSSYEEQSYKTILEKPLKDLMGLMSPTEKDLNSGLSRDHFISELQPFIDELSFF